MKPALPNPPPGEITLDIVRDKILTIQNKNVLLDSDVAWLYGVETMRVNEAVKRNPGKFPEGYLIHLSKDEWQTLISQFSALTEQGRDELIANCDKFTLKHFPGTPKAFTEKGLYMLATILKSPRATATTIAIVEAFARLRDLSSAVADLVQSPTDPQKQATVMQKSSQILSDLVTKELQTTGTETSFELNLFSAVKLKHTIKKELKHQKPK